MTTPAHERQLKTAEVAELFGVNVKTVRDWVHEGRLTSVKTPGGHYRYLESQVRALLDRQAEGGSDA